MNCWPLWEAAVRVPRLPPLLAARDPHTRDRMADAKNDLQPAVTACIACQGAHRRHTCALGGSRSGLTLTTPAVAPARSPVRAAGQMANGIGGTERDAAEVAAAAEGAATQPTRVSHRRSAPPLRLVEDGEGQQASKPAATAHDAVDRTVAAEPPAGAALAAPRVAAPPPRVSAGTTPADDTTTAASTAPVLWVGDSTFVRLTGCDAWGALQTGDLRSEIQSVNGEKPPELLRRYCRSRPNPIRKPKPNPNPKPKTNPAPSPSQALNPKPKPKPKPSPNPDPAPKHDPAPAPDQARQAC